MKLFYFLFFCITNIIYTNNNIYEKQINTNYSFEKINDKKNRSLYYCKINKQIDLQIYTIYNNTQNINIKAIDIVKFILNIFNIHKNKKEINELTLLFIKNTSKFGLYITNELHINLLNNSFYHIYKYYIYNINQDILHFNFKLNKLLTLFFIDILKLEKNQFKNINSYIEFNYNEYTNKQIEKYIMQQLNDHLYIINIMISKKIIYTVYIF